MVEETVFPFDKSSPGQRLLALQNAEWTQQPIDAPERFLVGGD